MKRLYCDFPHKKAIKELKKFNNLIAKECTINPHLLDIIKSVDKKNIKPLKNVIKFAKYNPCT